MAHVLSHSLFVMVFAGSLWPCIAGSPAEKLSRLSTAKSIKKREHMLPLGRTDLLDPAPGFLWYAFTQNTIPCTGAYGNKGRRYLFHSNTFITITLLMAVDLLLPLDLYSVSWALEPKAKTFLYHLLS